MKFRNVFSPVHLAVAVTLTTYAVGVAHAASLAEAFKEIDAEVRASIVKELIKSRSYDVEHTHKRPSDKSNSKTDANSKDSKDDKDGAAALAKLKEVMDDDDNDAYNRPSRTTSCNMEVANQTKETGKPTPRRTTVIITEPIMQICK
jgi:hypothetical protein